MANGTIGEDKAKKLQEMIDDEKFELDIDALETAAGGNGSGIIDTYADDYFPPCPEDFWKH